MKNTVNVDEKLVGRIREALAENEQVVFVTKKDLIAILPEAMRAIFISALLLMIAFAMRDVGFGFEKWISSTGIVSKVCLVMIGVTWSKFIVDTLNYNYEILAITRDAKAGPRAYYRKGFFLKKISPIKLSSLASTPIDQSKHFYSPILGVGNLRLDIWGSDDGDIYFNDCPAPFQVVQLINKLLSEKT